MKTHSTTLATHLQLAVVRLLSPTALATLSLFHSLTFSLSAAVPLEWTATPRNPAPVAFDRHHGETLDFRCTFAGWEGRAPSRPFADTADIRLWYQTNGMGAAWWSVPATISSNVLAATFPPQADPGADRLALFFGAPSNAYASAVLRLRHSPGFAPNILPPPEQATFEETDPVFAAWLAATELVHEEQDPTVPEWAKSPTPPASGLSTNDVCNIVTNEVKDSYYVANLPYNPLWDVEQTSATFTITDFNWHGDMVRYVCNGKLYETNEFVYGQIMAKDNDVYLYVYDDQIPVGSTPDAWMLVIGTTGGFDGDVDNHFKAQTRNALGLARLVDLPPLTNGLATAASLTFLSSQLSQASQDATNYTDSATNELARSFSVPDYANVSNAAMNALSRAEAEAGFTEWKFVPATDEYGNKYYIVEQPSDVNVYEYTLYSGYTFYYPPVYDTYYATNLDFSVKGVIATRTRLPTMADIPTNTTQLVNGNGYVTDTITNGLASVSSVAAAIASADTTYTRFAISAPTNINQSVQYINITDENPSFLSVVIPEGTGTKDWIIYVNARTNVAISLPAATWWLSDTSATNDIAPQTPTALYFSQAADNIFTMGRQEFTEVVQP